MVRPTADEARTTLLAASNLSAIARRHDPRVRTDLWVRVFLLVGLPLISLIKSTALDIVLGVVTVVLVGNGVRWSVTGFVPRSRSQWSNLALSMSPVIAVVLAVSIPGLAIGVVMGVIVGGAFLVSAVAARRA